MNSFFKPIQVVVACLFLAAPAFAQNPPEWTKDINALPDSANVFPVRTLNDGTNHILVMSTYSKPVGTGNFIKKIYLNKYTETGTLEWSLIFDNNGIGEPAGSDMAIDENGNCYIAGAFTDPASVKPLIMKVSSSGNVMWQVDSISTFWSSGFEQIFIHDEKLYLRSYHGIALFDTDGNEIWSKGNMQTTEMGLDHAGQLILSALQPGTSHTIFRYDQSGNINFSDSTIVAGRINTDWQNNILLLMAMPQYALVKYDSAGTFAWSKNDFPLQLGFGDIGYEVLASYENDVIVTGISDTMFKFSPEGNLIWERSMNGLDNYILPSQMAFNDFLAVSGTVIGPNGYDMKVVLYNLFGEETWSGYYNSNNIQEFPVDMTIDNSGVYVIEDNISNTTLVKFTTPFASEINYDLICIDSVWYEPTDPTMINVRIFNGNVAHLNYPSVQIVAPSGDTISNVNNFVNFFAHGGNMFQVYTDTIITPGITDFSEYTFIMNELFGDISNEVDWCLALNVPENYLGNLRVYPNPVRDNLFIEHNGLLSDEATVFIFDLFGRIVLNKVLPENAEIDVSGFASGIYILRITDQNLIWKGNLIKE